MGLYICVFDFEKQESFKENLIVKSSLKQLLAKHLQIYWEFI